MILQIKNKGERKMKNKMLALAVTLMLLASAFIINMPVKADPTVWDVYPGPGTPIQNAIIAASPGDTIIVHEGTYDEQVVINKTLTLTGEGDATIIKPSGPGTLTHFYTLPTQADAGWNGKKLASIISVENVGTAGVTISKLKVDGILIGGTSAPAGADWLVGILYGESAGTVENVRILNMDTPTASPPNAYNSYGIFLDAVITTVSVEVSGCTIERYNRNGIMTRGAKLTVDINANVITGPGAIGPTSVPNGVVISYGTAGTVRYNRIFNNYYEGITWLSFGIMGWNEKPGLTIEHNEVYDTDVGIGPTSGILIRYNDVHDCKIGIELELGAADNNIEYNQIHDNYYGIRLLGPGDPWGGYTGPGDEPGLGNKANYNNIYNNTEGARNWDTTQTFDARFNWWGDPFGPTASPPAGDKVSGYVDYAPWLIQEYPPAVFVSKLYVDPETKEFWTPAQGTKFSMNVTIANVTDLYGFEFKLTWNSTLIDLVGLQVKVGSIWTHYFIAHNETWHEPDGTDWYWLAASATAPTVTGFTGKATLVKLTFEIKYNPCYPDTCSTPIHFVDVKLSNSTADPIPVWVQDGLYKIRSSKPKLEMRPSMTVVHKYQDFSVEIWLLNATKVYDYAFEIHYNTTILDTANVIIHNVFLPGPYETSILKINEPEGSIYVELKEASTAPPANGNGLLVTVTFHVTKAEIWKKGQNNTLYSSIEFESWKLSVKCPEPRTQEGDLVSISNAEYWFIPILGDVNSDGVVNVVDMRMVSMNWDSADLEILKLVDLNCDGNVDIYDLVLVAKNLT
jgi:nitrous oxidase accessory protein NosD